MKFITLPMVFLSMLLLNSCLGINADITLNNNGSGTIDLEYQVSKLIDAIGRLDGNERWNTIPTGRADFERTLDRLPEMKLVSFSSREDDRSLNISLKMEFSSIAGLLAFLDSGGGRSSFSGDPRSGRMVFTLNSGSGIGNINFDRLIRDVCNGYSVRISMNFPDSGNLSLTDMGGSLINAAGNDIVRQGRRVSFSMPIYDILTADNGINAEFAW